MKIREFILSAFVVLIIASSPLMAQIVIMNNFDGDDTNDVGPAFQQLTNGVGEPESPGTFDPATGVIINGMTSTNATGFNNVSLVMIDPATTEFTATFVVDSVVNTEFIRSNGLFLGLVTDPETGTSAATGTTGGALFNNNQVGGLGLQFLDDNRFRLVRDGDNNANNIGGAAISIEEADQAAFVASLEDGFTFTITVFDDNTVEAFTTGLSTELDVARTEINNTDPNFDAFLMNGIGLSGSVQGGTTEMTISEVTLEATMEMIILKGDVNMDGIINFSDISPFILALSSPEGAPDEADCNCDGIVSFLDIAPFILKLSAP